MVTKKAPVKSKPTVISFSPQLVKAIFAQGNNGLSTLQVTSLISNALKVAGVDVPPGVTITLSAAQVIIAGGAIANDFEEGVSTLQCVGDIAFGLNGLANLLSQLGILPPVVSDFAGLAGNLTMVIGSGGANILADIGAVLSLIACIADVGDALFGSSAAAEASAKNAIAQALKATAGLEISDATRILHNFSTGQINMFDMIGDIAMRDPEAFASVFPGLAILFPTWFNINLTVTGTSSGLFSDTTATQSAVIQKLITNRTQIQSVLIENYLTKPMQDFESFETIAPIISLEAISVLALIMQTGAKKDITINYNFNVIGAMRGLGVTPSILGDDWLFKGLMRNEKDLGDGSWEHTLPYPPITLPLVKPSGSSLVVNNKPVFTQSQIIQNQKAASLIALQKKMQALDKAGDINGLLQIPEAVAMLKRWANFSMTPTFYTLEQYNSEMFDYKNKLSSLTTELNSVAGNPNNRLIASQLSKEIAALKAPNVPVGEITNMKLAGNSITTQKWYNYKNSVDPITPSGKMFWDYVYKNYTIDLSDYWRVLQTLQKMQTSNLFSDDAEIQAFNGSIDTITLIYKSALGFTMAKNLNIRMRVAIAKQLGISPGQMVSRYDSKGNLIFYDGGIKNGFI